MYMYTERERESERYIYIERERYRERDIDIDIDNDRWILILSPKAGTIRNPTAWLRGACEKAATHYSVNNEPY